jgi:hypothetical protein
MKVETNPFVPPSTLIEPLPSLLARHHHEDLLPRELSPLRDPTAHRLRTVLRLKPLAPSEAPVVAHPAQLSRIRRTGRLQ